MFQASRGYGVGAVAVLLALCLTGPAEADAAGSYKAALEAIEGRDWPEAARNLEAALTDQPKEKRRVRLYGMVFVDYLPHYHLGRVLMELGDCERALEELEISRRQGVAEAAGELEALTRYQSRCREVLARAAPPAAAPSSPAPSSAPPSLPAVAAPAPEESSKGTPPPAVAPPTAEEAAALDKSAPDIALAPPAADKARDVPKALRAAAEAYFAGRYQQALDQLAGARFEDPAFGAQAKLFESAAHYALHRRAGNEETTHLAAARAAARACRKLDGDLAPAPGTFSPLFLELFRAASK